MIAVKEAKDAFKEISDYFDSTYDSNDDLLSYYYSPELNTLEHYIKEQEKYQWHDLRKNPNDLPPLVRKLNSESDVNDMSETVVIRDIFGGIHSDELLLCIDGEVDWITSPNEVAMWKYDEPFQAGENNAE